MVSWGDLRRWNPSVLSNMSAALNGKYLQLLACSEDFEDAVMPSGWSGTAATAAAGASQRLIEEGKEWAAEIAAIRRASGDVADAATGVLAGFKEAEELARAHNFLIGDDGGITDRGLPPDTPEDQREDVERERKAVASELGERVKQTLLSAEDVDNDFCAVLEPAISGHTLDASGEGTSLAAAGNAGEALGSLSISSPPAVDAGPAANAAWWDSLSKQQQERLIKDHPGLVGNRDGVAAWARSKANLALLADEKQKLLEERTELMRHAPDDLGRDRPLVRDYQEKLGKLDERLGALDKINGIMLGPDGKPKADKQLLSLDMTGDKVKAAVANGDVDIAKHVSVFTPGMNSAVEKNLDGYVNDMQTVRDSASRMLNDPTGQSVATVTWLGYEPPATGNLGDYVDVIGGGAARDGAEKLARFDQGINMSRPDDPHLTALGHSYGSLTTGIALHSDTGVDDAVFFGSPGISDQPYGDGIAGRSIEQLHIPEGHAYTLEADGDPVADVGNLTHGRFGEDPGSMDGMKQLATHEATSKFDGLPLAASTGHSEYTLTTPEGTDSTSKYNMAAVIAGLPDLTVSK
ncbi:alpha/beta hydrolase [Amycolatopsis sp. lyj-90]|uniref:alpha/beta hydrolase n=1 Tax=Amycolatopsis sp. lyj-90 TaxID=2789285 RepID=UPI00397BC9B4